MTPGSRQRGFTLLEIMITLLIIGLVFAIAIPSYRAHLTRAERTEARAWLLRMGADQQSFFIRNGRYATSIAELRQNDTSTLVPNGDYRWQVVSTSPDG
ncbi:MAG: type IV pilin protein, partial [Pseudomonadota bacterium]